MTTWTPARSGRRRSGGSPRCRRDPASGCPSGSRRGVRGRRVRRPPSPSAASPTTLDVVFGVEQRGEPGRTSAWSSARATRIQEILRSFVVVETGPGPGSRRRARARGERAAEGAGALGHAGACRCRPAAVAGRPGRVVGRVRSDRRRPPRSRSAVADARWRAARRHGGRCWSAPPGRSGRRPGRPRRAAAGAPSSLDADGEPGRGAARPVIQAGQAGARRARRSAVVGSRSTPSTDRTRPAPACSPR